jgi:hypothetical protein
MDVGGLKCGEVLIRFNVGEVMYFDILGMMGGRTGKILRMKK